MTEKKLFNRNFVILSAANLVTFIAFYMMMPIIAMYVIDTFAADSAVAGVVVSSYVITALLTRPFSGYLVDKFDRRKFYLIVFTLFSIAFFGYIISSTIPQLILTRILLGGSFALMTTASSTIAIDIIPSERRAEGIGYYGAVTVLAMAIGPMLGLYLINVFSYAELFKFATATSWLGLAIALFVRTRPREAVNHQPLSLDRFFLREGTPHAIIMALLYFLYGTLMVYVSLYVRENGLELNPAHYFMLFSCGIVVSRLLSGKILNRGKHDLVITGGISTIILAGLIFTLYLNSVTLPISSVLLGLGFGFTTPAVQSLIIDLVPAARRGTANSTYFIALDFGSGLGMLLGGSIAHLLSYKSLYLIAIALTVIALIYYKAKVAKR